MHKLLSCVLLAGGLVMLPAPAHAVNEYNGHPLDLCVADITACAVPAAVPLPDAGEFSFDGRPITQEWYDRRQAERQAAPVTRSRDAVAQPVGYGAGLCKQLLEAKPWLDSSICN